MKRFSVLMLLATFLLGACSKKSMEHHAVQTEPTRLSDLSAIFSEDQSRTYVENNKYLRWHEDDRLTAFYGNTKNRQYKFNGMTGDNNGSFSHVPSGDLETGNTFDRIYAVYPYDETAAITDEGTISLTLPAVQLYAENSFGKGANTMIAVTESREDTFLAFKNACGYLKLKLYNVDGATIKSIEVKGNNGEKIAGAATATIAFGEAPIVAMADGATDTITIDCGDGVSLGTTAETATEFWVVIPEMTFTAGFYITITDLNNGKSFIQTENSIAITRNAIQPMAVRECVMGEGPETWRIYYETYSGETILPYASSLKSHIVSNTYADGVGIMKFDCEITEIPELGFFLKRDLKSITLPSSITSIGKDAFYSTSDKLEYVYIKAEVPPVLAGSKTSGGTFFDDVFYWKYSEYGSPKKYTCTIYVPRASVESYKSASTWEWWKSEIEPYDFN